MSHSGSDLFAADISFTVFKAVAVFQETVFPLLLLCVSKFMDVKLQSADCI